jgi:hypothetical protein
MRAKSRAEVRRFDDTRAVRSGSSASRSDSGGLEKSRSVDSGGSDCAGSRSDGKTRRRSSNESGGLESTDCGRLDDDDDGFPGGRESRGEAVAMARLMRWCFAVLRRCFLSSCVPAVSKCMIYSYIKTTRYAFRIFPP